MEFRFFKNWKFHNTCSVFSVKTWSNFLLFSFFLNFPKVPESFLYSFHKSNSHPNSLSKKHLSAGYTGYSPLMSTMGMNSLTNGFGTGMATGMDSLYGVGQQFGAYNPYGNGMFNFGTLCLENFTQHFFYKIETKKNKVSKIFRS